MAPSFATFAPWWRRPLRESLRRLEAYAGALARAAWGGFLRAAREIAGQGTFAALAEATPHAELNGLFREVATKPGATS